MTEPKPLWPLDEISPGVLGYTMEFEGATYIPLIEPLHPGQGDVGRFLDSLDPIQTWKVPTVVNGVLAGMLLRRGWVLTIEHSPEFGPVEVFVREPAPQPTPA